MAAPLPLTPEETLVRNWLAEIGIVADKLPENSEQPSCDFRAEDTADHYWIEVKSRTGDQELRAELQAHGHATRYRTTGYSLTMAAILDDAVSQLTASAAEDPGFRLVWMLLTDHGDAPLHFDQVRATVFGVHDVWDMALGEGAALPCYYFGESVFFKHKALDALVALDQPSGRFTMCVNGFSRNRESFARSKLYQYFAGIAQRFRNAIHDPWLEEQHDRAHVADCAIPRRDKAAVLAYVQAKYRLVQPIQYVLGRGDSFVLVPRPSPGTSQQS